MKYIKSYEHTTEDDFDQPQVGDYIITSNIDGIGRIEELPFPNIAKIRYPNEKYLKICPIKTSGGVKTNLVAFGKTPEEAKLKANAIKYNL